MTPDYYAATVGEHDDGEPRNAIDSKSDAKSAARRNRPSVRPTGEIVPGKILHLATAMAITGWGHQAFAKARKNGLKMIYAHNRAFVETDELIAYLKQQPSTPPANPSKIARTKKESA